MLTIDEIKKIINDDRASKKKRLARVGKKYYDGIHDIKNYRLFYYNTDGNLVEDTSRSNIKISHPFFTEIVDQAVQYMLSSKNGYVKSNIPELQKQLDLYFNNNETFKSELYELLTDCMVKGYSYMHVHRTHDDRVTFQCADSLGVVEVEARFASDKKEHIIYHYIDWIDKDGKQVTRIRDYDDKEVRFYIQYGDGKIELDKDEEFNPLQYNLYRKKK